MIRNVLAARVAAGDLRQPVTSIPRVEFFWGGLADWQEAVKFVGPPIESSMLDGNDRGTGGGFKLKTSRRTEPAIPLSILDQFAQRAAINLRCATRWLAALDDLLFNRWPGQRGSLVKAINTHRVALVFLFDPQIIRTFCVEQCRGLLRVACLVNDNPCARRAAFSQTAASKGWHDQEKNSKTKWC